MRYTDWFDWETNYALEFREQRNRELTFPNSVEKIEFELETREGKTKELETLIASTFKPDQRWAFVREDKAVFVFDGDVGVKEWTWEGPTTFGDKMRYSHHPDGETMGYVVKLLTFKIGRN